MKRKKAIDTRTRILQAALHSFAEHGIRGATTQKIARQAQVNEVTLFRYFKNKNQLLREVVLAFCQRYETLFSQAAFATEADLEKTIRAFARLYQASLSEKEGFIRTFFAELKRHPQLARRLFVEASLPTRKKFIVYLQNAQKRGLVRTGLNLTTAADAFTGMLLAGTLRHPLLSYSPVLYLRTCVQIFLEGIRA